MAKQDDAFLKKLLATFRVEADEHLKAMSAGLIELEKNPPAVRYAEIVENVFREAHSLKGAARAVNHKEVESVCQPLESVLASLKSKQLSVSPPLYDLLYQTVDALGGLLVESAGTPEPHQAMLGPLIRRLGDALQGQFAQSAVAQPAQHAPTAPPPDASVETAAPLPITSLASETVRVSTQKLDAVMRQAEELLSPQLASAQRARELREVAASFATWKKQRARIRPALRLIERYAEKAGNGAAVPISPAKFPAQEALAKLPT